MKILGLEWLGPALAAPGFSGKMVFNSAGVILFPISRQHHEMSAEGLFYRDNYQGNALAAMLAPGRIEVRFHKAFKDAEVGRILDAIQSLPELSALRGWARTYQGRPV